MSVLKVLTYTTISNHSLSYQILLDTGDNLCFNLPNCHCFVFFNQTGKSKCVTDI